MEKTAGGKIATAGPGGIFFMAMKLKRRCFLTVIVLLLLTACVTQRTPGPGFGFSWVLPWSNEWEYDDYPFYKALWQGTLNDIEELLKAGQNPNRMKYPPGEDTWHFRNPLWLSVKYYQKMALLIRYGADVKKRPYIASTLSTRIISERYPNDIFIEYYRNESEKEVYERVKLLLEAGADPNMRGTSSPDTLLIATDWNYRRWFNKYGDSPINNAIEYCAFSIVDLLLEYGAKLDEESLKMAKEATKNSGNTEMEDYIKAVWKKQQGGK